jgi:hypothetical protein
MDEIAVIEGTYPTIPDTVALTVLFLIEFYCVAYVLLASVGFCIFRGRINQQHCKNL